MERTAATTGHRALNSAPSGPCFHRLMVPCRPLVPSVAGRRPLPVAALSDSSSQGTSAAAVNPKLMSDKAPLEFSENPQGRSEGPGVKGERERVDAGDLLQGSSWEEWLKHFDTMDELAEDAAHYQVELNSAVRQERYGDAARHKRKLSEIQAADSVSAVQRQLQSSLASEQYSQAAELRDRGLVGLSGWWAGKDGPEDFQGHLLHVKPEFGRWTGRIYMARDIAAMNGWRENKLLQLLDRSDRSSGGGGASGGSSLRSAFEASSGTGLGGGTIGTPMMEVFVRQQQPQQGNQQEDGGGAGVGTSSMLTGTAGTGAGAEQLLVPGFLAHQAVALRPPAAKISEAKALKAAAAAAAAAAAGPSKPAPGGAAALNPTSVVRLSIHVAKDGSARISVLPPKQVKSQFSGWEEEEMRATMAALAGDSMKPARSSGVSTSAPSPPSATATASADESGFHRPADDEDDILTELTRVPAQVVMQGRDRFTFTVLEQDTSGGGASSSGNGTASAGVLGSADGAAASGSSVDLPRWAAVPIDEDESEGDEAEMGPAATAAAAAAAQRRASGAAATSSGGSVTEVPVLEVEVQLAAEMEAAAQRTMLEAEEEAAEAAAAAAAAAIGFNSDDDDEGDEDNSLRVSFDMLSSGFGRLDAVATSVTDSQQEQRILIEIPVGRLMRQQQRAAEEAEARLASGAAAATSASPAAAPGSRASKDTFDRLAERVSQLQTARAGRPVPPEHLATALRELAQRLVNGELSPDGSSAATATVPSPAQAVKAAAAARKAAAKEAALLASSPSASAQRLGATRISYGRIPTDLPRSDPFCGLYLGAFGPHGPELIQLSRSMQDGEETVCATKVTGDPNVPAGEVSFRAKVARRHRLDSRDVYPDELGIVARYKGEGRVAKAGYKSPRWVDGELLVFAAGSSPVTGGAELGFVWSVPGEKRFLILLNKLDLKECEK